MKNKYSHDEIIRRYKDGQSVSEIAAEMNCHPVTVRRALKEIEKMDKEYRNPEGYADPTAYKAIYPAMEAGELWAYPAKDTGEERTMLLLQVFDNYSICIMTTENLSAIPEGNEEKLIVKGIAPWVDCGRPQYVFNSRLTRIIGKITLQRLIDIRQKVADIILRGYSGGNAQEAPQNAAEAPQAVFNAEADKIPAETEKPRETPVNGFAGDAVEMTRLRVKAEIMEQVAGRLFGILEKQAERG